MKSWGLKQGGNKRKGRVEKGHKQNERPDGSCSLFALRVRETTTTPAFSLLESSLAALPPPPHQRAFHSDPEASKAGSLSAEHLGGMTAAPPPASAYRAPGEATPPPSGRALSSTTLIGFVGCGGGRMPPPSGVAGFRRSALIPGGS